jgi:hypothetical protein
MAKSKFEKFWVQLFKTHEAFGSRKFKSEREKLQVLAEHVVYSLVDDFERSYYGAAGNPTTAEEDAKSGYSPYEEGKRILLAAFEESHEEIAESAYLDSIR